MFSENLLEKKAKDLLEQAKSIAFKNNDSMVDTDHLLLALISKDDSPLLKILEKRGIDKKALKENITSYLNDIYSQINKAVEDYSNYLKNLQSQLTQARNQALEIYKELRNVKAQKERLKRDLSYEREFFFGGGSRLELERLTIYEKQLESNLNSLKSQLAQLTDSNTADKFLSGDINLLSFLYKIIENSSLIKQIEDLGFSKDRFVKNY
jgi:ATPases with chaperone activity, ATP-binding subunit